MLDRVRMADQLLPHRAAIPEVRLRHGEVRADNNITSISAGGFCEDAANIGSSLLERRYLSLGRHDVNTIGIPD